MIRKIIFFFGTRDKEAITDQRKENKIKKSESKTRGGDPNTPFIRFYRYVKQMSTIAHCCSWEIGKRIEVGIGVLVLR